MGERLMFTLLAADGVSLGDWVMAITAVVGSVTAAAVSIITAIRTKDVQRQVSVEGSKTIGEAVKETHDAVVDQP